MTTALLLYSNDKNIEEIQQIITFTEAVNLAKHVIGQTADMAMIVKKNHSDRLLRKVK